MVIDNVFIELPEGDIWVSEYHAPDIKFALKGTILAMEQSSFQTIIQQKCLPMQTAHLFTAAIADEEQSDSFYALSARTWKIFAQRRSSGLKHTSSHAESGGLCRNAHRFLLSVTN
jgi:hypothetical protein